MLIKVICELSDMLQINQWFLNRDCRKLLKIKYFFTFLFVLRPIFAAVIPKIKPELLACTDVRTSCVI